MAECRLLTIGRIEWMNRVAPLAHTLFIRNHGRLMQQGAEGLARMLGAAAEPEKYRPESRHHAGLTDAVMPARTLAYRTRREIGLLIDLWRAPRRTRCA